MYYLRTLPKSDAIAFTVDQLKLQEANRAASAVGGAAAASGGAGTAAPLVAATAAAVGGGAVAGISAAAAAALAKEEEVSIDGSPVKVERVARTPLESSPLAAGAVLAGAAASPGTAAASSPGSAAAAAGGVAMTDAERRKAEIRAALKAGTYEADTDVCISCGS